MKTQTLSRGLAYGGLLCTGLVCTGLQTASAQATMPRQPVMLSSAEISQLRANPAAFQQLLRGCDTKLNHQPQPVATFGPGDHYTASGAAAPQREVEQLSADADAAYRLGLCHLISGKREYASAAQRILDAWSQKLTRVTTQQGRNDINFNMPYMVMAASWVRGVGGWHSTPFDTFLRRVILPQSESANPNNHGLWGVLLESSIAAYLGDARLLGQARTRWGQIIAGAVSSDGTMTREVERSDTSNWRSGPTKGIRGLAYTHYAMLPAAISAKIFADAGQPVWRTPSGQLFGKAFARAAGWTLRPQTFPYYASNGGQLQGVRNAAYFALLVRYYPNKDAETVLAQGNVGLNGFRLLELFGRSR